jgi:hypothetical protein
VQISAPLSGPFIFELFIFFLNSFQNNKMLRARAQSSNGYHVALSITGARSAAVLQPAVRTSILNPTILLFSPSTLCTYWPKIRPSFFPFVSWELGSLFPSLCPCSLRQIDAAAAAAAWPPPLNHVRAMLLSKWSRSSTQGWQARCIVRGLSAYHTSPGRLAVSRSLRVWTELHQAIKVLVLMEQYFLVHVNVQSRMNAFSVCLFNKIPHNCSVT